VCRSSEAANTLAACTQPMLYLEHNHHGPLLAACAPTWQPLLLPASTNPQLTLGKTGLATSGGAEDRGAAAAENHRLGVREHRGAVDGFGNGVRH